MSLTMEAVAIGWFWLMASSLWILPGWIVMTLFTPRELVARYFREPHFNRGEIAFASSFPGSLYRTGVLMGACFQDRYRRNRHLEGYLQIAPRWFVVAAQLFALLTVVHLALVVGLLIFLAS